MATEVAWPQLCVVRNASEVQVAVQQKLVSVRQKLEWDREVAPSIVHGPFSW